MGNLLPPKGSPGKAPHAGDRPSVQDLRALAQQASREWKFPRRIYPKLEQLRQKQKNVQALSR